MYLIFIPRPISFSPNVIQTTNNELCKVLSTNMTFGNFAFINCFFIAIFVNSSLCQVPAVCNDCCSDTTYKVINDPRRSTGSVWKKGERALCDRNLKWGWYRFKSFAGDKMPDVKVDADHCGTHAPIWLNGRHPKEKGENVVRQACINAFDLLNGCWDSFDISIKNCGDYYVYYLRPPNYCAVAYCAGENNLINLILSTVTS